LDKAFAAMDLRTIADLIIDKAQDYITRLVTDEGNSLTTRNHHCTTLKSFGKWLEKNRRLHDNPVEKLEIVPVKDSDRTHESRVFTVDELMKVCDVAKPHHRLIYLFTAYTGFRHKEDKFVTWADLDIDTEQPTCTLRNTKNGDTVVVNLPTWLAGELRLHRAEEKLKLGGQLPTTRPVLHIPRRMVHHLRKNAAKAGLGEVEVERKVSSGGHSYTGVVKWIDPANPKVRLDFHDLRGFYATLLFEQNVPNYEIQRLCRHSSIETTMKHYTAWRPARLRDHVDQIPNPLAGRLSVPASVDSVPLQSGADHSGPAPQPSPRRANS
jgi:integrase